MKLKEIRESKKFTQDQIADKLSVTRQAVSRWENEKTQPDIQTLLKLSEIYDCSIDDLVLTNERSSKKSQFSLNRYVIWIPIFGLMYSLYYLFSCRSQIPVNSKRIIIARVTVSLFIVVAFTVSYVSFNRLLN